MTRQPSKEDTMHDSPIGPITLEDALDAAVLGNGSELGRLYAIAVKAGHLTAEDAGDTWVALADLSYGAGLAFERAYDREGGPR